MKSQSRRAAPRCAVTTQAPSQLPSLLWRVRGHCASHSSPGPLWSASTQCDRWCGKLRSGMGPTQSAVEGILRDEFKCSEHQARQQRTHSLANVPRARHAALTHRSHRCPPASLPPAQPGTAHPPGLLCSSPGAGAKPRASLTLGTRQGRAPDPAHAPGPDFSFQYLGLNPWPSH